MPTRVLLLALCLCACTTTQVTGTCVPGRVEACPCLNGSTGAQTCGADGTFGACECADAGVADDLSPQPDLTPEVDAAESPDLAPLCSRMFAGSDFSDPTPWVVGGGASITGGQGHLPTDPNCFATMWQRTCVGPVQGSSDLRLLISGSGGGLMSSLTLATASGPMQAVGLPGSAPLVVCLGERAHTNNTLFQFGRTCGVGGSTNIDLTSVTLVPGGCPIPGAVLNGDFSAAGSGWTAILDSGSVMGIADFSANTARLGLPDFCAAVILRGWISVPTTTLVKPAVSFSIAVTGASRQVAVTAGIANDSTTVNATATTTKRICLNASNKGLASQITFITQHTVGGSCGSTPGEQVVIDNVQLLDDPTCP